MAEQTLSIPQLIAVGLIGFFLIRWLFFSPSSNAGNRNAQASGARQTAARRVDPQQVEQVAQMFPQASRRDIQWDLQRNGGSVAATVERVLSGRLEMAPPSFQPLNLTPSPVAIATTTSRTSTPHKAKYPDLITRYNLGSRVKATEAAASSTSPAPASKQGWSQNKTERQSLMQQRKEEMILAARRKMEDKDKQKAP
ncbi:hypothetical protein L228DRAFT_280627 [Xylona heveae TC161]|uniref:Coupling of ubiquitin conjugation to ER degradation protein 1 n=1 Tax=Xylona heveae (strain CBS 132557 / TC161) TaxID=1328760 RepID=A0A165ITX5_XYLHT|nr:hypothetical protein L228DRAFT_280627 [Xylona heveae TC161]KZF25386.1 hypothetical protein L228DRAFT_280627 [Xylona heveae TC161]